MLKHTLLYFFVFLLNFNSIAQQKFIKTIAENDFGVSIRVLPTDDLGWVVFSMDSLKLIKFNRCGEKEWTRHFLLPNTHNGLNYFIKTHNGGFALLTRNLIATKYGSLVTKLDALGNIVWSKSLENIDFNQFPYTISEDATGNLFLFANVIHTNNSPSYSMISKIDANGILIWSRFYHYGVVWGGAITTSDNGILVRTGRDFIKIDGSGNLQWSTQINASFYYYLAAVEVSDGYIFTGYSNGNNLIGFYKMDKQGTLIGGTRQVSNFAGNPPMLYKTPNGNIAGVFNRGGSFNVHPTIVELDKDLNFVKQSSLGSSLYDLIGKDVCFLFDGTPVLAGVTNNNLQLFYAKMDEDYHTQCDVNLLNMTLTPETISQSFFNSTITQANFNFVNQIYYTDTFSISVNTLCNPPKSLNIGNDTLLCKGTTLVLKNNKGDLFDNYNWSTGETTASILIHEPGTYWLCAWDHCGQNRSNDTVWITIMPAIEADLGEDKLLCENNSISLHAPHCDSCTFQWSTGSTASLITINKQGVYWLEEKNNNGCISKDSIKVNVVKCECDLFIPNSFTPNNDALNEIFKPEYYCDLSDFNLTIFNRWGQLLFQSSSIVLGWDGKFNNSYVSEGIYLFVTNYTAFINGQLQPFKTKSGTVSVIY